MYRWIMTALLALAMQSGFAQSEQSNARSFAWMGGDMLRGTASLVETALTSHFFLDLSDALDLTPAQRDELSEINQRSLSNVIEKGAEIELAASEIRFLLSRPEINLTAVETAVARMHRTRAELQMDRIRSALEAVGKLDHDQHRMAITAGERSVPDKR